MAEEKELGQIAERLGGKLEIIQLCEIDEGDRYRKDYGDLNELATSMELKGQLQNLVVCVNPDWITSTPDDPAYTGACKYHLLAGGRRFRCMVERLNWTECRALVFDRELDECECLEIEWEENSRRKDLEWKEDCALKKRIQDLREAKYGVKVSTQADAKGTSIRDTAAILNVSPATMSEDIALAKANEVAPQLFEKCKTKKEAKRALKIASEAIARSELAKKALDSAPAYAKLQNIFDRYLVGDFFEGVKSVPDGSVDFVEIDPPYAINLKEVKKLQDVRYSMEDYNEVEVKDYLEFMAKTLTQCWRVMASNSFGVLWFAPDPWQVVLYDLLTTIGFETTRLTGKWIKPSGQTHQPAKYLANACEEFFYFWKGSPSIVRQGRTNVFQYTPVAASKKTHPTERPLELILEIISTFCWEGSRIMVPFLGSGKTILAAEQLGMRAFGWELSEGYKDGFIVNANEMFSKDSKLSKMQDKAS